MPRTRYLAALACALLAVLALAPAAGATITTRTVDYGSYTIPAGSGDPMDHEGLGSIDNRIITNVTKPCTGCDIIKIVPDLVDSRGNSVNVDTGPMLHHAMLAASGGGKSDATCAGRTVGTLGERFFASGNERTVMDVESLEYGYEVTRSESWNMVIHLTNWAESERTVYVRMTYTYATGSDASERAPLRPVWLDQAQCSLNSLITVPPGESDTHYDWEVNVPGDIVFAAGHIHDYGVDDQLTNMSAEEELICDSVAGFGESSGYITPEGFRHISSMSTCSGTPLATIRSGQTLRLHTIYDVPREHEEIDNAMGIMIIYVNPA